MKLRILIGALLWTTLVSLAHLHLNIGWAAVSEQVRVWFGEKRKTLDVGFLPVT